jgi:hypothetical protein
MLFRVLLLYLLAHWLPACGPFSKTDVQQAQATNLRLTRTLHTCLNQRNWPGLDTLFAPTVRYRGRALGQTELEISRAQFLAQYRRVLRTDQPGRFALRQLYPAGAYHVIVEGITTGPAPDTAHSFCLIYTIENQHISRVCAY